MLSFQFAAPWALLGLLLIPLLPGKHFRLSWLLRAAALGLLLLALAGPEVARRSLQLGVLVDTSASLGDKAANIAPPEASKVYYFASETAAVGSSPNFYNLGPEATDIAKALQVASTQGVGRLLLLSDGGQSSGNALDALPDVPVDTFYVSSLPNVRLMQLFAPRTMPREGRAEVTAMIQSDRVQQVTLRPQVAGKRIKPLTRTVPAGESAITFVVSGSGLRGSTLDIRATLDVPTEQPTQDDLAETSIQLAQTPPVLVINDPATLRLLKAQNIEAIAGSASAIRTPLNYSAIVLRESASAFTPAQLELLKTYVQEGGGLLMSGGKGSFGLGGWYRTPLEGVLPVKSEIKSDIQLPQVAMVLIVDRSQSMTNGTPTKLELAKAGATDIVDLAYARDQLGFLTFSDKADWVFPLRSATAQGKREMVQAILNVQAGGGTILAPAYSAAIRSLQQSNAAIKHIILLTDGQVADRNNPDPQNPNMSFTKLADNAKQAGITTSTIAIGTAADSTLLRSMALDGGGRFYEALKVSTLPRIFSNEALTASRSLVRQGPFAVAALANPLISTSRTPPAVAAYIATSLKPGAETIYQGKNQEAILAVSRQGLGRSAALTTDLNSFAGAFARWPALPGVMGTLARWLQIKPDRYNVETTPSASGLNITVDTVQAGEFINDASLEARFAGQQVTLQQIAPGRYQAQLKTPAHSGTLNIVERGQTVASSVVNVPNSEFAVGQGQALLRDIAQRSGGRVLSSLETYNPELARVFSPLWMWPALAALLLFLSELVVRRSEQLRVSQKAKHTQQRFFRAP